MEQGTVMEVRSGKLCEAIDSLCGRVQLNQGKGGESELSLAG